MSTTPSVIPFRRLIAHATSMISCVRGWLGSTMDGVAPLPGVTVLMKVMVGSEECGISFLTQGNHGWRFRPILTLKRHVFGCLDVDPNDARILLAH